MKALEDEVSALSAETTRLRLMVQRCCEQEQHRQQLLAENEKLKTQLKDLQQSGGASGGRVPQSTVSPMTLDALPAMFSGAEGTARLFRAIMEAYPWLVPAEVKEAQEIVRQEKALQAEERRLRHQRRIERQQLELQVEAEESRLDRERLAAEVSRVAPVTQRADGAAMCVSIPLATDKGTNDGGATAPPPPIPRIQTANPKVFRDAAIPTTTGGTVVAAAPSARAAESVSPVSEGGISDIPLAASQRSPRGGSGDSPTQAPTPTMSATTKSTAIVSDTGVVIGSRPSTKKTGALVKRLQQGVASDSDEEHATSRTGLPAAPVKVDTTSRPSDDHDF